MATIDLKDIDSWFPDSSREEWKKIVNGEINHTFKNYVVQLKSYQISKALKNRTKTEEQGLRELEALCRKYALAVYDDFKIIFNL